MAKSVDSYVVFDNLLTKFSKLQYGRTKDDRNLINQLLDELNKLDFRLFTLKNTTKALLLVNQCCSLIPPDDSFLIGKCCHLITKLINYQHVQITGKTLTLTVQWCLLALKNSEDIVVKDVLILINVLLQSNIQDLHLVYNEVICPESPVVLFAQKESLSEIMILAVRTLEICTLISPEDKNKYENFIHLELCMKIFLKYLLLQNRKIPWNLLQCKLIISCLKGVQNIIVIQDQNYLSKHLGTLLGIAKSYMVYGIKDINFLQPQKLMPSALSTPEYVISLKEKKGGKVIKQRKRKKSTTNKKNEGKTDMTSNWSEDNQLWNYLPASTNVRFLDDLSCCVYEDKYKTSDSDFSDSECSKIAKLGFTEAKLRQAALNLLLNTIKLTDKKVVFSYWSSFIPDGSPSGQHNLITCLLKEPSAATRMTAFNLLFTLLGRSKLYLAQAEHCENRTSFTPFSAVLGFMIQELHHCLRLALNDNSTNVLTQALKCFAALVQATPYHRLTPGILTKVIRSVKVYIDHKDVSVQVTALIVLGCVLASEPPVPETKNAFLKNFAKKELKETPDRTKFPATKFTNLDGNNSKVSSDDDFSNDNGNDDDDHCQTDDNNVESILKQPGNNLPWLLEKCLKNLGVDANFGSSTENPVSAAVKLESAQIISAMTRNYFMSLIAPHLQIISTALQIALQDKYADLRLHAGRTVDFVGQAMTQSFKTNLEENILTTQNGLIFWSNLLSKPLLMLIQNEEHAVLRAVGCDCLGSIGPNVFECLPREKQIFIITSLLNSSRDEENSVKGAAVRALAISVLYPSLRQDHGFVIDTAETIYNTLQDSTMMVRIKASWSLGNLSDALVMNKNENAIEEISDELLLKLMEAGINGFNDNDKIKTNVARALGNFLQLITITHIADIKFKNQVEQSIAILVKNASVSPNMKVKWNACYALGNILKNENLYKLCTDWQNLVFTTLSDLIIECYNFKVRINAGLALSCPSTRAQYGNYYYSVWNSLLKALENSQNVEDFTEFKHRDQLIEQICLSIGHLTTLLHFEDLNILKESFAFYLNNVKTYMHKIIERLVPEKTGNLFAAAAHIQSLHLQDLTSEQRNTLNDLEKVFNHDV